jgi:hypothetical protein
MVEQKQKRQRDMTLGAGEAFDRLCVLRETRAIRRKVELEAAAQAFDIAEAEHEGKLMARVPEAQRERLDRMLAAMPGAETDAAILTASRGEPAIEPTTFAGGPTEPAGEPVVTLPKGATEYTPGPAARAARGR